MTIAFVSTIRSPWGGSEELWAACADAALQSNLVVISAMDCGTISAKVRRLVDQGAKLDLRIGAIPNDLPMWQKIYRRFLRVYRNTLGNPYEALIAYRPDIVLYIGTAYSIAEDHKLLDLIRRRNIPFFINVQLNSEGGEDELSGRRRQIVDKAYSTARNVFFVSARNKETAERALGHSYPRAMVVRNPVNLDSIELLPMSGGTEVQFAMVGNLRIIHKGQDLAMEALSAVKWKERYWHMNVYGSGEDEKRLREMVDAAGLRNRTTFHGRVSNIRDIWRVNQVLIMPSRMEGMPLAIVEAMLCGRPCVATDVGGAAEWIEDGRSGFIAEAVTAPAFDAALERAWQAKDRWSEIGSLAHQRAMALYDPAAGRTLLDLMIKKG